MLNIKKKESVTNDKDAGKYGWGSPDWFYICWDRQPPKKNE
jgi:hypothetical protein